MQHAASSVYFPSALALILPSLISMVKIVTSCQSIFHLQSTWLPFKKQFVRCWALFLRYRTLNPVFFRLPKPKRQYVTNQNPKASVSECEWSQSTIILKTAVFSNNQSKTNQLKPDKWNHKKNMQQSLCHSARGYCIASRQIDTQLPQRDRNISGILLDTWQLIYLPP